MYTPPMFKPDRAAALAFAEARGFGTVCAWNGKRPIASSLPFYLDYTEDGTPTALFHFALGPSVIHPYLFDSLEFFPGGAGECGGAMCWVMRA